METIVVSTHSRPSFWMFSIFVLMLLSSKSIGQTQAPSVQTGVTFQWSDTQVIDSDPATINSITIDGAIYGSFAAASSYVMTRVGPNGHNSNSIVNGVIVNNSSANLDWAIDALAAFQDINLNHYFTSNVNGRDICGDFAAIATTDAQIQSLYYDQGIPSNSGGVIAITDRNANNCYYISVYGIPSGGGTEQFLGDTFVRENASSQWGPLFNAPAAGVDYWNSGRVVENGGTLGMAIFQLNNLAPVGSTITRVDLTASTVDHGDGKLFILQRYAMPRTESQCTNFEFNGTIADSPTIPSGSTFSLVSAPVPAGQAFTFNPDGSYSYTPDPGYVGDVIFGYQVCLPAPNTSVCDASTVTITYKTEGCNHCSNSNADGPLLRN